MLEVADDEVDKCVADLYTVTRDILPINLPAEVKVGQSWAGMTDQSQVGIGR